MILLDHNIPADQAELLGRRRIHFQRIGHDVGRPEWDDQQEILRLLRESKQATFFTRDLGFFRRTLCHSNYCIVVLAVPTQEISFYIHRLLRHRMFRTKSQRQGKIVKISAEKITMWEIHKGLLTIVGWE